MATGASTYDERQQWKADHLLANDTFVVNMPKVELHVHIEGTMTPSLRWKLSQRHHIPLTVGTERVLLTSLREVEDAYTRIRGRIGATSAEASKCFTFFQVYYSGFDLLLEEQDFYELAMDYFKRAAAMNVRYCEPFFDPQGHTRRGVPMKVIMNGFKKASETAKSTLNISSQWIMCFLRDMSVESAIQQYEEALPYKHLIVGVGLDSDEYNRPPSLFYNLFLRARNDGLQLTSHCDFNQHNTHEHILQVATALGGDGASRIDHGLNAADKPELMDIIKAKGIGMTICPCAYIRHTNINEVFPRIRKLFDAGIKISIASDDPSYMEDNWVLHNLLMVRNKCSFSNEDMVKLQRNAIQISWASCASKEELYEELNAFEASHNGHTLMLAQ